MAMLGAGGRLAAQLPEPDPFQVAAGGTLPALGASAGIPANPAGLAGGSGWQLVASPLRIGLGLTPISGADLTRAGDGVLSREIREAWLRSLDGGPQRGTTDVALGPIAIRRGSVSFELASVGTGRMQLPADAVELILFGNAGRDGAARDLRLDGARLDGAALTTVGIAWGTRVSRQLSVGARLHASIGHGVLLTRDAGSVLTGGAATAALRLPTISSTGSSPGFGVGVDLGVTWTGSESRTGVSIQNAGSDFRWSDGDLRFREGETLIEGEGVASDFSARPVGEAPPALRALVRRLRPARRIEIEHVRALDGRLHLRVLLRQRLERGLAPSTPDARLVGLQWRARSSLALAAHAGSVEGDARVGAGARFGWGAWGVSGAWLLDRGDDRRGSTFGLSFNWELR